MAAAETEFCSFDYTTGSVVWYRSSKQIGWWPCVVSPRLGFDLATTQAFRLLHLYTQVSRVHDDSGVHLKALGDGYE